MVSRGFELSRLKAPAAVVAAVFCFALAIDTILHASFGFLPASLARAEYLSHDRVVEIGRRVTAVVGQRRRDPSSPPLAIVVGFSTAREGLVPSMLEEQSDQRWRWLNLASSGGSWPLTRVR